MKKGSIDYSIIWKYINDNLTDQEESALKVWLSANKKHQEYFDQAIIDTQKEESNRIEVDSIVSWNKLNLEQKKPYITLKRISIAASFLFLLSISSYVIFSNFLRQDHLTLSENISFDPGVKKATLILESGKKLNLHTNNDTIIEVKNARIKNTKNSLNYLPEKKMIKRLEYNQLVIPRGAEYFVILSDSTKIWVNSETTLRYPVNFGKDKREVYLTGEAFFEVKKDTEKPFIVHSNNHKIKVHGTSFNVSSYSSDDEIVTTLTEGLVTVYSDDLDTEEHPLHPGFQSRYSKTNGTFSKKEVDIVSFVAWKDGRFIFKEKRLDEIMKIMSRWYDVEISFGDNKLKEIRFTGNLKRYDNIQAILDKLTKTNELKFSAYGKKIIVN